MRATDFSIEICRSLRELLFYDPQPPSLRWGLYAVARYASWRQELSQTLLYEDTLYLLAATGATFLFFARWASTIFASAAESIAPGMIWSSMT